ncbi:hypothetical protein JW998_15785 [candidate division KSB1 bacterium]|nr:hypothetical protein [candidate division KSB1 bacterium]
MDALVDYIIEQYRKGFSLSRIRTSLRAAGHEVEQVEEAVDHAMRRRLHHHALLVATVIVMAVGLVAISGRLGGDIEPAFTQSEIPTLEIKHLQATMPVPRNREECDSYVTALERQVCMEKYHTLTPHYYPEAFVEG